jgi:hypothetical protein
MIIHDIDEPYRSSEDHDREDISCLTEDTSKACKHC